MKSNALKPYDKWRELNRLFVDCKCAQKILLINKLSFGGEGLTSALWDELFHSSSFLLSDYLLINWDLVKQLWEFYTHCYSEIGNNSKENVDGIHVLMVTIGHKPCSLFFTVSRKNKEITNLSDYFSHLKEEIIDELKVAITNEKERICYMIIDFFLDPSVGISEERLAGLMNELIDDFSSCSLNNFMEPNLKNLKLKFIHWNWKQIDDDDLKNRCIELPRSFFDYEFLKEELLFSFDNEILPFKKIKKKLCK